MTRPDRAVDDFRDELRRAELPVRLAEAAGSVLRRRVVVPMRARDRLIVDARFFMVQSSRTSFGFSIR